MSEGRAARGRPKRRFTKTEEGLIKIIASETVLSGGLWCTKRELAERLGCHVNTVRSGIADLRRRGVIVAEPRYDDNGAQVASVYRIVIPAE